MSKKKNSTLKRLKDLENSIVKDLLYTDTHFHYSSIIEKRNELLLQKDYNSSPWITSELENLFNSPNFQGMDIGTQYDDLPSRYKTIERYKNIHLSSGVGPWGVDDELEIDKQLEILKSNLSHFPVSAIGEIGLDNYWKFGTPKMQEELFTKQLDIANELHLPIIIHTRDADEQTINILKAREFLYGGIIHCFSGGKELAKVSIEKGLFISFAGPITYKKNEELREILFSTPLNSLLLETDSPYLPPEPFRGKYNSPLLIPLIYEKASEIKNISIQEISTIVSNNFLNLLGNPKRLDAK